MTYHCATCTDKLGIRPIAPTDDFLGSHYQRSKKHKHTVSSATYPVQSVLDETSEDYYRATISEAYRYGAVEVTSRGTDILFCPSAQSSIGYKQRYGTQFTPQDTFRVVKSDQSLEAHAFLNSSSDYSHRRCVTCGGPVF